jgi:hypothetical protein
MTKRRFRASLGRWAGALMGAWALTLTLTAARADQAICVGVNHYKFIPGSDLAGCVNDAKAMQGVFEKNHFLVTLITDDQATKAGILKTIQDVAAKMKPTERFAFYFAGHGTPGNNKTSNLLPSDADAVSEDQDLTAQELYKAISAVPAVSRSVFLDSCFSGGMKISTRGLNLGHPDFKSRSFIRVSHARDLVLVNSQNTNTALTGPVGDVKVCYLTASRENEQSGEDSFGGKHDGVLTHFLVDDMTDSSANFHTWGDLSTKVNGQVVGYTNDLQHPTLSSNYTDVPIFSASGAAPAGVGTMGTIKTTSLWDAYNTDHANPFSLQLSMNPNQTTLHVNDQLSFSTSINSAGYLLIIEHGVSGKVNLLFPASGQIADAQVKPHQTVSIPADTTQKYAPDQPGTERIKAMLFANKEAAAALLAMFPHGTSLDYVDMKSLPPTEAVKSKFITADITFEVVPADASADGS